MISGMHASIFSKFSNLTVASYSHGTHCAGTAVSGP